MSGSPPESVADLPPLAGHCRRYVAVLPGLGRPVEIRVLPSDAPPTSRLLLSEEAGILERAVHDALPKVLARSGDPAHPWYATPLRERGTSVTELQALGGLSPKSVLVLLRQLAEAGASLQAAGGRLPENLEALLWWNEAKQALSLAHPLATSGDLAAADSSQAVRTFGRFAWWLAGQGDDRPGGSLAPEAEAILTRLMDACLPAGSSLYPGGLEDVVEELENLVSPIPTGDETTSDLEEASTPAPENAGTTSSAGSPPPELGTIPEAAPIPESALIAVDAPAGEELPPALDEPSPKPGNWGRPAPAPAVNPQSPDPRPTDTPPWGWVAAAAGALLAAAGMGALVTGGGTAPPAPASSAAARSPGTGSSRPSRTIPIRHPTIADPYVVYLVRQGAVTPDRFRSVWTIVEAVVARKHVPDLMRDSQRIDEMWQRFPKDPQGACADMGIWLADLRELLGVTRDGNPATI